MFNSGCFSMLDFYEIRDYLSYFPLNLRSKILLILIKIRDYGRSNNRAKKSRYGDFKHLRILKELKITKT